MPRQVDWLIIGTSDIARKRGAGAIAGLDTGKLVGVCGSDRRRVDDLADAHGAAERFTDIDAALAQTHANAVYIATPVHRHRVEALKALDAGKHVLIEKPLALSAADAQPIIAKAERTGLTAACAFYRRTYPRYQLIQQMLRQGTFGKVVLVRATFYSWFNPAQDDPKRWRVDKRLSGGGPLADVGSHMFDLIIGLFGVPARVFAHAENLVHDYEVEDSSAVLMKLANGAHVLASMGWNTRTHAHEFEVVGAEAKVGWLSESDPVLKVVGRERALLDLPNAANVHTPLVEDFARAILDDREPLCPVAEAARTNVLLDAIYRSAATGQEIML